MLLHRDIDLLWVVMVLQQHKRDKQYQSYYDRDFHEWFLSKMPADPYVTLMGKGIAAFSL
jgi:hypothetical protein